MIVYHNNGIVFATHANHQDAPAGSYPGTSRKVVPDNTTFTEDEVGRWILPKELIKPSVDDVRAEAQRRIIALSGATTLEGALVKQMNAQMRASEIINKKLGGETLTAEEQAESIALQAFADKIKTIRKSSNLMESDPPEDFLDDSRWE